MVYMILESDADREAYRNLWEQSLSGSVREGRAFCPGASPPDNSCSPANKDGSGARVRVSDASEGSPFEKELHYKTEGGIIKVAKSKWSPADWSITETFVDEDKRRKGIASALLEQVKKDLPGSISAQASSDKSVALFWKHGFRLPDDGTIDDARKRRKEDSSVLLIYDPAGRGKRASRRAFCPGASPPDNSCSPANKDESPAKPKGDPSSKSFKDWFSGSVAVNDDGSPLLIWRGGQARETFDPAAATKKGGEYGIFVTARKGYAETYARPDAWRGAKAHPYYISIRNPLFVENKGEISPGQLTKADIDRLKSQGYDSIAVVKYKDPINKVGPDPISKASEIVLFEDSQIVSAAPKKGSRAFCPGASPPDNSCSPANKGEGGHVRIARERPESTTYSPASLADGPAPALYEGGELKDGQTVWDRYSVASSASIGNSDRKDSADGTVDYEIKSDASSDKLFSDPYGQESQAERQSLNQRMPLRVQYDELAKIGAAALGVSDSGSQANVANPDKDANRDAWIAQQYTSSITVDAMQLMSHIARTPEQQAEMERELATLSRTTSERVPTQQDVDRLSELARTTELPEGVTLFHGMPGVNERKALEELAASGGTMRLNKLTSATTRPAVATQFSDTTSKKDVGPTSPESWASNGAYIHEDGTIGSVVRILRPRRGLPMGSVSIYRNEAEVLLAPASNLRFTGARRRVYIPAANDSGWPSDTFSTKGAKQAGPRSRTLVPVIVYDAVME